MPKPNSTSRRANLQRLTRQLLALETNPDCPWPIQDAIRDHLADLLSAVPIWEPSVFIAAYPALAEAAQKKGLSLSDGNLLGQVCAREETRSVN